MEQNKDTKLNSPDTQKPEDLSFQVMPRLGINPIQRKGEIEPLELKKETVAPEHHELPQEKQEHESFFKSRGFYVGIAVVVAVIIAGGLYLFFANRAPLNDTTTISTRLPKVWLTQYFNAEGCQDAAVCGDEADPDNDGLTNIEEFKEGTSPISSDTDQDGLADGDEVNVYKTDPVLKYTDRRVLATQEDYNDGHSLRNNYDPLTPGIKLTETRMSQIASDTVEFGLHEPTTETLNNDSSSLPNSDSKTVSVFIEGNEFLPQISFVNAGDTVVWLNKDREQHKITYSGSTDLPNFDSTVLGTDQTYSFTFDVIGTYEYSDQLNPSVTGTIEVR